ncbi:MULTISPECIES: IS66 family transposase [unclassified Bradyrhizobium]|uniref:IS66 family transposase n=1 Tax=unclassified Bradyrhizobium TaxID=2631580 RepID=UPI002915CB69|nr:MULTISPECIES: IS66 family transposase [unclassified Bradyrhizobium]
MTATPDDVLPDDFVALRALLLAERAERAQFAERIAILERLNTKLEFIVAEMKRAQFGRKSERITDDQLSLALDELETAAAKAEAEAEKADPARKAAATRKRRASRDEKLDHLPHQDVVIEPESKTCPCCGGELHAIGEDVSKRLDKVPAQLRVIVTRRPKYACRSCERTGADEVAGIIQAPAPMRLVEGGLPTEAFVADVVVSKYADHLPLYRQSQILARQDVRIERSTLAQWVGAASAELQPLHDHLLGRLKASSKLFCDETRCPVLDPGRGKTKTGYLWAIARDDRPWGGSDPPAVVYAYAPGRGGVHAMKLLDGFTGVLQVDGYAGYNALADPARPGGGPVTLAYCWSHLRRKFYEVYVGGHAPIATQALARIKQLYAIEEEVRGLQPELRRQARRERSGPVIEALKPWFEQSLAAVPKGGKIGEALAYGLNHWNGLTRFLDDGRIELDSNTVERSIRGLALNRKNALFAGNDLGAENWATIASLVETCKLNAVDPLAWMTDTLTKLVNLWPASRINELMPWAYAAARI